MIYLMAKDVIEENNLPSDKGDNLTVVRNILSDTGADRIWMVDDYPKQTALLKYVSVPYKAVLGIPQYHTPSDMMNEMDNAAIISFDQMMKTDFGKRTLGNLQSILKQTNSEGEGLLPDESIGSDDEY